MKFTVEFDLNEEQVEELKMLQQAMLKYHETEFSKEEREKYYPADYYTLDKVFEFVMTLSSIRRINKAIENAAYHYDKYYEDYPYKYGCYRTEEIIKKEKETGEILGTAYPNPRIDNERR